MADDSGKEIENGVDTSNEIPSAESNEAQIGLQMMIQSQITFLTVVVVAGK